MVCLPNRGKIPKPDKLQSFAAYLCLGRTETEKIAGEVHGICRQTAT